ncbi:O-antigen ligase family protein [Microbacterium sp. 22242]|uniref:O-antigen ligase family protein n=1 Tax=Microbacterium sp. 22242 TaxID=3453896 RepID=UPI003F832F9B
MRTEQAGRRHGIVGACTLALFVNAGSIKSNTLLAWLPIDLTILLGALLGLTIIANLFRHGLSRATWIVVGIVCLVLLGATSAVTPYGISKWQSFLTVTLLALIGAVTVLRDERQRRAFLGTIAVLGVIVTLLVIVAPESNGAWTNVVTLEGSNTISTAQMILAGAIVIVMDAIATRRRTALRFVLWVLASGMVLTALTTGSRGPVISIGISVLVAMLFAPALRRRRLQAILAIGILVAVALYFASQSDGLTRVTGFLAGDQDNSTLARSSFWDTSWRIITKLPFGGGWGYFGSLSQFQGIVGPGQKLYPHSVPTEITLEAGWLAGLAFLALVIAGCVRLIRRASNGVNLAYFVLLVFTIINSLSSGDINDNRLMWVLLVVAWVIPKVAPVGEPATTEAEPVAAPLAVPERSGAPAPRRQDENIHAETLGLFDPDKIAQYFRQQRDAN